MLNFEHRLPLLRVDVVVIEGVLLVAVGTSEIPKPCLIAVNGSPSVRRAD